LAKQPKSCIYFGKAMGTDVEQIGDVVAGDIVPVAGEKLGKFHSIIFFTESWEMALMDADGKNFGGMFVVAAWDVRMICSLHILRKSLLENLFSLFCLDVRVKLCLNTFCLISFHVNLNSQLA